MKIIILTTSKLREGRIFEGEEIYKSAAKKGLEAYYIHPNDLVYFISGNNIKIFYKNIDLSDTDIVFIRRVTGFESKVREALIAFKKLKILIVSNNQENPFPNQKIIQQLKKVSLFPKSIYFTIEQKENIFEMIIEKIGFPFVLKPNNGVGGKFVYKIENKKDFLKYFKKNKYNEFIAQEVLDIESEYRVLVLGGKSLGACEKISDKFIKNACQGSEFIYKRIKKIEEIAEKYVKTFGSEFAGVDIVKTRENKIKLLEINYCPGFMAFSKASSIDVAGKIIDYCLKRYKNFKK